MLADQQHSPGSGAQPGPAAGSEPESPADLPERKFGWWDMWAGPDADPRERGGGYHGERETLVRYLRDRRLTLEMKCSGLDTEGLARRSVPPSNLSLLGLLRHMAGGEQFWFRLTMAGQASPRHYRDQADPNGDFNGAVADPEVVADAWARWRAEVEFAEQFVARAPDLEITGDANLGQGDPEPITLREVLVHMIEEYARHNGHADLLRERVDGRVGQ